jgi:hypothetical protein
LIVGATVFFTMRTIARNRVGERAEAPISEMHAASAMPVQKAIYEIMGNVPNIPVVELPVSKQDAQAGVGAKPPSR